VGPHIPLVLQLGKWRRGVYVDIPNACTTSALPFDIHMPRTQAAVTTAPAGDYGDVAASTNLPFTAVSTGNVDPLECVLLKMGVAQTEFTPSSGTGRIHVYGGGTLNNGNSPGDGP